MPLIDAFQNDCFGQVSLTTAINKLAFIPKQIGTIRVFEKQYIYTTAVAVEEQNGKLSLVHAVPRGTAPEPSLASTRKARKFEAPHYPACEAIMAADIQNVRPFGQEVGLEQLADVVNDKNQIIRNNLQATIEYSRSQAIQGKLLNDDGTELYNWFTEFGITEKTVTFQFTGGSPSDIKIKAQEVIRIIQNNLGNDVYQGIVGLCSDTFWDYLVANATVKTAFTVYTDNANSFLRNVQMQEGFYYAGIWWLNYRGTIGTTAFIPAGTARFFPVGVPGLFQEVYCPADWMEFVNTKGQEAYSKLWPMKLDLGVEVHGQSNCITYCTRPGVCVKGASA